MKKLFQALSILLLTFTTSSYALPNWYDNFIFKDKSFTYELIRTLGYTYSGGADIGEVIRTAKLIPEGNIIEWYMQWSDVGNRLYRFAENLNNDKNITSAQEAYFRSSNYYRTASFYMDAPENRAQATRAWQLSRVSFLKAITNIPYIRTVRIPYENTSLPGYYLRSKFPKAPLLIVNTGFDGTAEELYFEVGLAAHRRGYNVLLFEGPGQGEVIKQQHIPFRYDWEKVITPTLDFALKLPDIDNSRIALLGISMGGYLAARAAAFEPRLAAVVLNGGIYNLGESFTKTLPPQLLTLASKDPKQFNAIIYTQMARDINAQWAFNNAMWVFNVATPLQVIQTVQRYNLANVVDKIKCPTLVIDSMDDQFFKNQPQQVYNLLQSRKTLMRFTEREAAEAHCQVGAIAISNEKIFNWLDATLKWHPQVQ